eukprot:TRINITY_DN36_c0_g2_i1.p1 TRINITY_DN36_c0_g2~~TRINITY_DN36_c0_g2_i1.p1  ORF type:complete len:438 (+),score=105.24 TRINITY_DN36_c0_g2_i1:77-1390(+)
MATAAQETSSPKQHWTPATSSPPAVSSADASSTTSSEGGGSSSSASEAVNPIQAKFYLLLPCLPIIPITGEGHLEVLSEALVLDNLLCARSESTYPVVETSPGVRAKNGEPNADAFAAVVYENQAVIAIADGCSWGVKPYRAARHAVLGVANYISLHDEPVKDVHEAGRMMLRAMCEANNQIFARAKDTWDAGTTTLLCACIVELQKENQWGVILCGVGDCKAIQWSEHHQKVVDITHGDRSLDLRDPGGRLGPYTSAGVPDLRNLSLHYVTAKEGDMIILATDGVYDNLDPASLGYDCKDVGLGDRQWKDVPREELAQAKATFLRKYVKGLLKGKEPSPETIVNVLIENAISVTEKVRAYMETTGKKQPANTKMYPGKMDHTTAIAFRIGHHGDLQACGKWYHQNGTTSQELSAVTATNDPVPINSLTGSPVPKRT